MEYVKEIFSKRFKAYLRTYRNLENAVQLKRLSSEQVDAEKRNLYPQFSQLIRVARKIMTNKEIEKYLTHNSELINLENEMSNRKKTIQC